MGILADYEHVKEKIKLKIRDYRRLELQVSQFGLEVPTHLSNQLENIERELEALKSQKVYLFQEFWDRVNQLYDDHNTAEEDFYIEPTLIRKMDGKAFSLNDFTQNVSTSTSCITIEGAIGSGKTYLSNVLARSLRNINTKAIPIVVRLRDIHTKRNSFEDAIGATLVRLQICDNEDIGHFLALQDVYIILDGLDEFLIHNSREGFKSLCHFAAQKSHVIITTRPGMNSTLSNPREIFEIGGIDKEYITKGLESIDIGDEYIDMLLYNHVANLLNTPFMLFTFLHYMQLYVIRCLDRERTMRKVFILREVLYVIIKELFYHNSKFLDIEQINNTFEEFKSVMSRFAFKHSMEKTAYTGTIASYSHAMGIITDVGSQRVFTNDIVEHYFVARFVHEGFSVSLDEGFRRLELASRDPRKARALHLFPEEVQVEDDNDNAAYAQHRQ